MTYKDFDDDSELTHFPTLITLRNVQQEVRQNLKSHKDNKASYLKSLKSGNYAETQKYLDNINSLEKDLEEQLKELQTLTREIYEEGVKLQTIVTEESGDLTELDNKVEKNFFKVQNLHKELINSQATKNNTHIAASSAQFQYYTYTILATILLGYLVLRK